MYKDIKKMGLCCSSANNGLDGKAQVPENKKEQVNSKRPLLDYLDEEDKASEANEEVAGSMILLPEDGPMLQKRTTYKSVKGDDVD